MEEYTIIVDGIPYTVKSDASARQAIQKLEDGLKAARKERDGLQAKLDAANQEKEKLAADLDAAQDPARVDSLVKERAELIEKAKRLGGPEFDCSGSARSIQERALAAKGVTCDGKSDDYVAARFDAAIESLPQKSLNAPTIKDAVSHLTSNPKPHNRVDHSQLRSARARFIERQRGGN